jgi:hypothetical protein
MKKGPAMKAYPLSMPRAENPVMTACCSKTFSLAKDFESTENLTPIAEVLAVSLRALSQKEYRHAATQEIDNVEEESGKAEAKNHVSNSLMTRYIYGPYGYEAVLS